MVAHMPTRIDFLTAITSAAIMNIDITPKEQWTQFKIGLANSLLIPKLIKRVSKTSLEFDDLNSFGPLRIIRENSKLFQKL